MRLLLERPSFTDMARTNLVAEQAAVQARLVQVAAASRASYVQDLANRDLAFRRAEGLMAREYSEELEQVVATERRAFRKHDAIRNEEAAAYFQAWQHHKQLSQWDVLEAWELVGEHAELLARAAHLELAAPALSEEREAEIDRSPSSNGGRS